MGKQQTRTGATGASGSPVARRACALVAAAIALAALAPAAGAQWLYGIELARFWAEPGDTVPGDHVTGGYGYLDRDGSPYQLAEDEGLVDRHRVFAQFGYDSADSLSGRYLTARGRANSDDRVPAAVLARGGRLASHDHEVRYFRLLHYDNPVSDDPYLTPPFALRLPGFPVLRRERASFRLGRSAGRALDLEAGYELLLQNGRRAGLTRSPLGRSTFGPPAARGLDLETNRAWLGARYAAGRWTFAGFLDYQIDSGDSDLRYQPAAAIAAAPAFERRRHHEQQNVWLRLGSSFRPSERLLLLGSYGFRLADATPEVETEAGGAPLTVLAEDGEVDVRAHTGLLGVVVHPRPWLRLQGTARLEVLDRAGVATHLGSEETFAIKRASSEQDRTRQTYGLRLHWSRSPAARYLLAYRLERRDEDRDRVAIEDHLGGNVLVRYQSGSRERTLHEPLFRSTHRFGPLAWSNRLRYRHDAVEQEDDVLAREYAIGDRTWDLFSWRSALRLRPVPALQLEAGYELVREEIEREDVETVMDWNADRLFALGTWRLSPLATLFATFHIGWEEYGIGGPLPPEADQELVYSPVEYDTRTCRLSPGLSLSPGGGWSLEGHYERVRNRDSVANDNDRWFARVTKRLSPGWSASAFYRHHDFTEFRGNDYDADLYAVSMTAHL